MYMLGKCYSIHELESILAERSGERSSYDMRSEVRIAVIDDQDFSPLNNLNKNNYNIRTFKDIESIGTIRDYQIILCDLSGVGKNLNPDLEGAHIIKEIKLSFPDKYVIAYTGGSSNKEILAMSVEHADKYLQKDSSIDEWQTNLDAAILHLKNPVYIWKRLRPLLLENGVTAHQLCKLEHDFVKSFSNGKSNYKDALEKNISVFNIQGRARIILSSLISNAIFNTSITLE